MVPTDTDTVWHQRVASRASGGSQGSPRRFFQRLWLRLLFATGSVLFRRLDEGRQGRTSHKLRCLLVNVQDSRRSRQSCVRNERQPLFAQTVTNCNASRRSVTLSPHVQGKTLEDLWSKLSLCLGIPWNQICAKHRRCWEENKLVVAASTG